MMKLTVFRSYSIALSLTAVAAIGYSPDALSNSLRINLLGISSDKGEVGCALFEAGDDFPMGSAPTQQVWTQASAESSRCEFDNIAAGTYAVSVSHDLNGNRRTDTNFFGIPKEAWGVSNNVRPKLRAPRFEEAAFTVEGATEMDIEVLQ